jgi:hypothetical protein
MRLDVEATRPSGLVRLAEELVDDADRAGAVLRLAGSVACYVHCPRYADLLLALRGGPHHDLDFVAGTHAHGAIRRAFENRGFVLDEEAALASDRQQLYFSHPREGLGADVYLGRLDYCHPIDFAGRLDRDRPTVPVCELLLAKLQIVELTASDIGDISVLVLEHELAANDRDAINLDRLVGVLARDWGFHYTARLNLAAVDRLAHASDLLADDERLAISERIRRIGLALATAPKSRCWRLRGKLGPRLRWYQEVDEKMPAR